MFSVQPCTSSGSAGRFASISRIAVNRQSLPPGPERIFPADRCRTTQASCQKRKDSLLSASRVRKNRWVLARLLFITYIGISVTTLVGGFLTAPLMSWYFFNDWRFWRHWHRGVAMLPHSLRLLGLIFRDSRGFMFSVPLSSPPARKPDPAVTILNPAWKPGNSCGDCSNCCRPGGLVCPLLDESSGLCTGYNSFYWRYFNCGRFPSVRPEIEYYDCNKWLVVSTHGLVPDQPISGNSRSLKGLR